MGVASEEVPMQGFAKFIEEVGVYAGTGEYVVDVASVAVYLAAQPCDSPLLTAEFLLDCFSYMY